MYAALHPLPTFASLVPLPRLKSPTSWRMVCNIHKVILKAFRYEPRVYTAFNYYFTFKPFQVRIIIVLPNQYPQGEIWGPDNYLMFYKNERT